MSPGSNQIDAAGLFESPDPALLELAADVFRQCVLGKVMPPEGYLKRRWLQGGTGKEPYYGQWLWDTMFVLDLLALLPDTREVIRDIFRNYWDFQDEWNARMPDYAHDMITCNIKPGTDNVVAWPYSQIPILAWGLERVYRRNGDRQLLELCLARLERFHEWYWRERDVRGQGLVAIGAYSGKLRHARWETFDDECNMDDLQLTPHPERGGECCYGDICVPGNTAYLVMAERCLARLAGAMGDTAMAARRQARIDASVEAMRTHMWDEAAGLFLSVHRDTLAKVPVGTIGSWIPLTAGVPTPAMAERMVAAFKTPNWSTPLPVPTVDRADPRFDSGTFWRGDVWPATNYQIASGLADYGYRDLAAELADTTVRNALVHGISERYDSLTGAALGVPYIGMCCTIVTMMTDGLCAEHAIRVVAADSRSARC